MREVDRHLQAPRLAAATAALGERNVPAARLRPPAAHEAVLEVVVIAVVVVLVEQPLRVEKPLRVLGLSLLVVAVLPLVCEARAAVLELSALLRVRLLRRADIGLGERARANLLVHDPPGVE